MNVEMAYLLGMITGDGEAQEVHTETTISIDIPHKRSETNFENDVGIYVRASITDIRTVLEPIRYFIDISQSVNYSLLSFRKPNEDYLMREVLRYIEVLHHQIM